MLKNFTPKRGGVTALQIVFVVYILAASVVSLLDSQCCERTNALTLDGIFVGVATAAVQLLVLTAKSKRICSSFSLFCVARVLIGNHVRNAMAGGYTFGVTLAVFRCFCG